MSDALRDFAKAFQLGDAAAVLASAGAHASGQTIAKQIMLWEQAARALEDLGAWRQALRARRRVLDLLDAQSGLEARVEQARLISAIQRAMGDTAAAAATLSDAAGWIAKTPSPLRAKDLLAFERGSFFSAPGGAQAPKAFDTSDLFDHSVGFGFGPVAATAAPRAIAEILKAPQLLANQVYVRSVHFVTRRRVANPMLAATVDADFPQGACLSPVETCFDAKRSGPTLYGKANVTLPVARRRGALPKTGVKVLENPLRHVVVDAAALTKQGDWRRNCGDDLDASGRREILLFVHGTANSLADALKRTAQLADDLEVDGLAVAFAWPSVGHVGGYVHDVDCVDDANVAALETLILDLLRHGPGKLHLIAHSMGCRFLAQALQRAALKGVLEPQHIQEVIFAAPDMTEDDFVGRAQAAAPVARRLTLYASAHDLALYGSQGFNGSLPRIGAMRPPPRYVGFDSVDATDLPSPGLGHGYFADALLDDLQALTWHALDPRLRRPLMGPGAGEGLALRASRSADAEIFCGALTALRDWEAGVGDAIRDELQKQDDAEREMQDRLRATLLWVERIRRLDPDWSPPAETMA